MPFALRIFPYRQISQSRVGICQSILSEIIRSVAMKKRSIRAETGGIAFKFTGINYLFFKSFGRGNYFSILPSRKYINKQIAAFFEAN